MRRTVGARIGVLVGVTGCSADSGDEVTDSPAAATSMVGFNEVELCQWVSLELTTMRRPIAERAREATGTVIEAPRDGITPNPRVELATAVVVRESTASPGAAGARAESRKKGAR